MNSDLINIKYWMSNVVLSFIRNLEEMQSIQLIIMSLIAEDLIFRHNFFTLFHLYFRLTEVLDHIT